MVNRDYIEQFNKEKTLVLDFARNDVNPKLISSHITESEFIKLKAIIESEIPESFLWDYMYSLNKKEGILVSNIEFIYDEVLYPYQVGIDIGIEHLGDLSIYAGKIHNLFEGNEMSILTFISMGYPMEVLYDYISNDYVNDKRKGMNDFNFFLNINKIYLSKIFNLDSDLFEYKTPYNLDNYMKKLVYLIHDNFSLNKITREDIKQLPFNRDEIIKYLKLLKEGGLITDHICDLIGLPEITDIFIKYDMTNDDMSKIINIMED